MLFWGFYTAEDRILWKNNENSQLSVYFGIQLDPLATLIVHPIIPHRNQYFKYTLQLRV